MGRLILVTGGVRSGKSSFAEQMAAKRGSRILYVATSKDIDDEMHIRIRKHREKRPSSWDTLEAYKGFENILPRKAQDMDAVLIDCVTVMTANLVLEQWGDRAEISAGEMDQIEQCLINEFQRLVGIIKSLKCDCIAVTNETGMGVVPPYPLGRAFRDISGRVNQLLADNCEEVYFCVAGIPIKIKG